jgi:hypothetical protein
MTKFIKWGCIMKRWQFKLVLTNINRKFSSRSTNSFCVTNGIFWRPKSKQCFKWRAKWRTVGGKRICGSSISKQFNFLIDFTINFQVWDINIILCDIKNKAQRRFRKIGAVICTNTSKDDRAPRSKLFVTY